MTPAQMETFRRSMNIRPDEEWSRFEGLEHSAAEFQSFLDRVPFASAGNRNLQAERIAVPESLAVTIQPRTSTQLGFGALLNELGRDDTAVAARTVTASPDVTVSTSLGPWVNRRVLFAREALADTFKSERIPSTFNWEFSPNGQHIELGIAEMNLFSVLAALGLSHVINGERLLPIGTLYDPFIARGLDALNYACYQDARFILAFARDYMQREGGAEPSERNWLRDETGGSVYLRLSTRPIEQIKRDMTPSLRQSIVGGAYWLGRAR